MSLAENRPITIKHPFVCLVAVYLISVLLYTLLNGYCKHLETYMDEIYYYSMAEGFAKDMGLFTFRGEPSPSIRIVYSLLISPAFLTGNRILQFRLITLINSLVICSGVFPVYLLAYGVLKDRYLALLSGFIYVLLPDMQFTASFMTENAMLPLSLWVVFLTWKLSGIDVKQYRVFAFYAACWIILSAALVYVKSSGYVVVIVSFVWFVILFIHTIIRNKHILNNPRILIILSTAACIFVLIILFLKHTAVGVQMFERGNTFLAEWATYTEIYIRCYFFTWASELLALGIFPMILPIFSYKKLAPEAKSLFAFLLLLTGIANWAIVHTSVWIGITYSFEDFPLYHRYAIYIWLPYLIVFFDALRRNVNISKIGVILTLILTTVFCVFFRGAVMGSSFEASMLWWAWHWMDRRWLMVALVVSFVLLGFILLALNKKCFVIVFTIIMTAAMSYNHFTMNWILRNAYQFEYKNIADVESMITDNSDSSFLVVTIPTTPDPNNVHINSKIADTFLLYPNSYFVPEYILTSIQTNRGIDLTDGDIRLSERTNLNSVDYIILTNEMSINKNECKLLLSNTYFSVYRLSDPSYIPSIYYND